MSEKSNSSAGPDSPTPADAPDDAPTPADPPARADDPPAGATAADAGTAGAGTTLDPIEIVTHDVIEVEVDGADDGGADGGGADDGGADEVARLTDEVARLQQEKQDTYDRLLRQAADLENFRRRSKRDVEDATTAAKTAVLVEMLPVVDNLELAVKHAEAPSAPSDDGDAAAGTAAGIIDGVKLVLRQFAQAFERCGVTPIEAQGTPFDPNVHEAISQIETAEHPPGSVAQVYQRGYKIGERLLRPSLVVVAKAPPAAEAAPEPTDEDDATQPVDVPEVPPSATGGGDATPVPEVPEAPEPADEDDATQPVEVPEMPAGDGSRDRETDG